ncbi:MAG: 6,7-dimethyl-8-ribityllumazine synthase [Elusimicrobia bacterium]|nr:6,7-dimethyl-8-ribityllumazine synthase [Elusimicrobiota bacterium]
MRLAIIVSTFNKKITGRLLNSAITAVKKHKGAVVGHIVHVPGSFELPMAAKMLTASRPKPDAIICLGVIIQGETDQNTYIANACALGIQKAQLDTGIPIGFGIISADSEKLALARTKGELDRGREAAEAAMAMAELKKKLIS